MDQRLMNDSHALKIMLVFKISAKIVVFVGLWTQTDSLPAKAVIVFYLLYSFVLEGKTFFGKISQQTPHLYFYSEVFLVLVLSIWFHGWPYLVLMQIIIGAAMFTFEGKRRWWTVAGLLVLNFLMLIRFEWSGGHVLWDRVTSDFSISIFATVTFGVIALLEDRRVKLQQLNLKLEEYAAQVEELAVTKERNRMAREIHDTVAHGITGLIMQLQAARKVNPRDPDKADQLLKRSEEATREVLREMRQSVRALAPEGTRSLSGDQALRELIDAFSHSTEMGIDFDIEGVRRELDAERQAVLYRVLQEALTNAKRHGKATNVTVDLKYQDRKLAITIRDNGKGFVKLNEGFGLSGMKSRVHEVQGELTIKGDPGNGCEVGIAIPYDGSHM